MKPDHIPQRAWDAAMACEVRAEDESEIASIAMAIMAETEACAALIDCDCDNGLCDLKDAAELIRSRNA
jgi:hypothetical protein